MDVVSGTGITDFLVRQDGAPFKSTGPLQSGVCCLAFSVSPEIEVFLLARPAKSTRLPYEWLITWL